MPDLMIQLLVEIVFTVSVAVVTGLVTLLVLGLWLLLCAPNSLDAHASPDILQIKD